MLDTWGRTVAVTLVLTATFVGSAVLLDGPGTFGLFDVGLLAANTLPLLLVRRNPLAVVLVLGVAYTAWMVTDHASHMFQSLPTLHALFILGTRQWPLWLRAIGLVVPAGMLAAVLTDWWVDAGIEYIGYVAAVFLLVWWSGVIVAGRQSYAERLKAETAALEEVRQELADRAVADERARIARELHDVVAHAMSVITVRAGVGAHLIRTDPAQAAEALAVIEHTGREANEEMRRMLAVLRDPDPRSPRAEPQPGLDDLPELVEHVAAAGLVATVTVSGPVRPLPAGLDLAAYRVVQEALTNVVKHAHGARATVTIQYRPDGLTLEVRNRLSQRSPQSDQPVRFGQGLRGMAERVGLYDGDLDVGSDIGGFGVTARFPLPEYVEPEHVEPADRIEEGTA